MSDENLQVQLGEVIRALAPDGGLFALQFAYLIENPEHRHDTPSEHLEKGGGQLRSPRLIEEMSERAGGRVVRSWRSDTFGAVAFHAVHIQRA